MASVHEWREPGSFVLATVIAASLGLGCASDLPGYQTGSLGGQVVISGPLRGAAVAVDQIDLQTGELDFHIGETTTSNDGRFSVETGLYNGLVRVTVHGGIYQDRATGATIQLDATDELTSLTWFQLVEICDDVLVSPIGHMIDERARAARAGVMVDPADPTHLIDAVDMTTAVHQASETLGRHFGRVNWLRVRLADLGQPAISPTEPVRAALVHASLSYLARDIAAEASVGPQEVNVYQLMRQWTEDIRTDRFDGDDDNSRVPGSGLQLGECPPVDSACVIPPTGCTTGSCRARCDQYAGTARSMLGGTMTRVIRDSSVNQTGLDISNTIGIARAISNNPDTALFGDACVETLDRTPPSVVFQTPTPGELAFVRGAITVKALAVDDTEQPPLTTIIGFPDMDGDPTNNVAQATIDTTAAADGSLEVQATAVDLAGNVATAKRTVRVDNTAPVLTLSEAGFFNDGSTWWAATATPTLEGTIQDSSPVTVQAIVAGGAQITGTVTGTTWSVVLPMTSLDPAGTPVSVIATDAAGNQRTGNQRIRPDLAPPALGFQSSIVNDEASEPVDFGDVLTNPGEVPTHLHSGTPHDLSVAGPCPSFTKHSYLLDASPPAYGIEQPARNPIQYQLVTDDPGVGIAAGSTQYRVGRRSGTTTTTWIVDWTSAGTGTPIGTGTTRFPIGMFSNLIAGLATTEGVYDVQFRATDRLSRTSTVARCFDLHLKAPPMKFTPNPLGAPTLNQPFALNALSLAPGAPFDLIAARLLNEDATGASLIDQAFSNGTAATVYLTVTVTKPAMVTATRAFFEGFVRIQDQLITTVSCQEFDPGCEYPPDPSYAPPPVSVPLTTQPFPVKVFELVNGIPTTEIPCIAPCPVTSTTFTFAIPPRSPGGQAARQFIAMTMIDKVTNLRPTDAVQPAPPPYVDGSFTYTNQLNTVTTFRITGKIPQPPVTMTACTQFQTDANGIITGCRRRGTFRPVRVLTQASLSFSTDTGSRYATAPTAQLAPLIAAPDVTRSTLNPTNNWTTSEGLLP